VEIIGLVVALALLGLVARTRGADTRFSAHDDQHRSI
jgi:hypothetical protein